MRGKRRVQERFSHMRVVLSTDLNDRQEKPVKLMKKLIAGFAVVMTFAANASSANAEQKGVAGSWTLSAEGYVLKMVLAQSGKKITGTLQGPSWTHAPEGKVCQGAGSPFPEEVLMASAAGKNFR